LNHNLSMRIGVIGFTPEHFKVLYEELKPSGDSVFSVKPTYNALADEHLDTIIFYLNEIHNYDSCAETAATVAKFAEDGGIHLFVLSHNYGCSRVLDFAIDFRGSKEQKLSFLIEKSIKNVCNNVSFVRVPRIINSYPKELFTETSYFGGMLGLDYDIQFIQLSVLVEKLRKLIHQPAKKSCYIPGTYGTVREFHKQINAIAPMPLPLLYVPSRLMYAFENYVLATPLVSWRTISTFQRKCHERFPDVVKSWFASAD
jgi:hypothetical protein